MAQTYTQTMIINNNINDHVDSNVLITPLSPQGQDSHFFDNSKPPSFESILSGTSLAPYSRVAFSNFLRKNHCSENLDFLLNSNQYLIRCSERSTEFDSEIQKLWQFIYTNYISPDSLKEVNIPHDLREELTNHFDSDTLPECELIERTMISIKDLLRDGYLQFIQTVRKSQCYYADKINENYSLLTNSTGAIHSPSPKNYHINVLNQNLNHRRYSESCSPLEPSLRDGSGSNSRCVSPLSSSGVSLTDRSSPQNGYHDIPRSDNCNCHDDCNESREYSMDCDYSKNHSISTSSTKSKNSISEASTSLKKFAGKFRWRRMSSNSSASS